jgi:hypothetical protein
MPRMTNLQSNPVTLSLYFSTGRLLVVFIFMCNLVAVIIYIMDTTSGTRAYTDKKENTIFLIYKEIQMGAVA